MSRRLPHCVFTLPCNRTPGYRRLCPLGPAAPRAQMGCCAAKPLEASPDGVKEPARQPEAKPDEAARVASPDAAEPNASEPAELTAPGPAPTPAEPAETAELTAPDPAPTPAEPAETAATPAEPIDKSPIAPTAPLQRQASASAVVLEAEEAFRRLLECRLEALLIRLEAVAGVQGVPLPAARAGAPPSAAQLQALEVVIGRLEALTAEPEGVLQRTSRVLQDAGGAVTGAVTGALQALGRSMSSLFGAKEAPAGGGAALEAAVVRLEAVAGGGGGGGGSAPPSGTPSAAELAQLEALVSRLEGAHQA
jgi:hypothetical protein